MHDGDPRGQMRARFGGRTANTLCTGCHARARRARGRPPARAPRSGGRRGALRRLPHAPDRLRRARRPPQPPHRDPRPGARRGRRPPRRLHRLPRRAQRRLGRGVRPAILGRGPLSGGRRCRSRAPRRSRRCSAGRRSRARSPPTRSAAAPCRDAGARARRLGALLEVMAADGIRRSATWPGAACDDWPRPTRSPGAGWPPTTTRPGRLTIAAGSSVVFARLLGDGSGPAARRPDGAAGRGRLHPRSRDLEIGE